MTISNVAADPGELDARSRTVTIAWLVRFWGVHENVIYRDIRKGALRAFRLPGGQLRVLRADALHYGRPVVE
jgi:hypothetical protein